MRLFVNGFGRAVSMAIAAVGIICVVSSGAISATLPAPIPCDASRGSCFAPAVGDTWQWQLSCDRAGTCTNLDIRVDWYDIDAFDNPASTVEAIHDTGAHAACYISAGTFENWRPDARRFKNPDGTLKAFVGRKYDDWPGERWLDIRRIDKLLPIMVDRMKMCREKGFDGVQLDNLDGFQAATGFPLTRQHAERYAAVLANEAHKLGLSAAWENAVEIVPAMVDYMDWFVMESCYRYGECKAAKTFTDKGKFVGSVEYAKIYSDLRFCSTYDKYKISGFFKKLSLNSFMKPCWE